jgi:hypothetical protein
MMERSHLEAEDLIRGVVSDQGLKVDIGYGDVLDHCTNDVHAAWPSWKRTGFRKRCDILRMALHCVGLRTSGALWCAVQGGKGRSGSGRYATCSDRKSETEQRSLAEMLHAHRD